MIEKINNLTVKLLGDPHLGRSFLHGTPLHRRGEREQMQWVDFEMSLMQCQGIDVHVCMGDLFDKWTVPYTVIYRAAQTYLQAAKLNPNTRFVIIRGNHDASRDLERVSAFKLLTAMVWLHPQIIIADDMPKGLDLADTKLSFMPWDPVLNAAEMVEKYADFIKNADAIFGHWDVVEAFGSDNLIPAKRLQELGVKRAITGHDHHKRDLVIDDLPVKITGSMQPYSHGEDHDGLLYISLSKTELESIQPSLIRDKCVRVLLREGESIDKPVDCLQFTVKRLGDNSFNDEEGINVEFEGFDFDKLLTDTFDELKVDPAFRVEAVARYESERSKQ